MSGESPLQLKTIQAKDFAIGSIDQEILVDRRCVELVRLLYRQLTEQEQLAPEQAGALCQGADYFLREFIIGDRHENLLGIDPQRVRQFAGHWYIVRTMEPNLKELGAILAGTEIFYRFLADAGLVPATVAQAVAAHCRDLDSYRERIESFWTIDADGYDTWRRACPLEPAPELS